MGSLRSSMYQVNTGSEAPSTIISTSACDQPHESEQPSFVIIRAKPASRQVND
jgi:hypothetical protein